jgi:hypothetical protein
VESIRSLRKEEAESIADVRVRCYCIPFIKNANKENRKQNKNGRVDCYIVQYSWTFCSTPGISIGGFLIVIGLSNLHGGSATSVCTSCRHIHHSILINLRFTSFDCNNIYLPDKTIQDNPSQTVQSVQLVLQVQDIQVCQLGQVCLQVQRDRRD